MRLADFIETNRGAILADWDELAARVRPAESKLTREQLRDHGESLLAEVVEDLRTGQSAGESGRERRGESPRRADELSLQAKRHAWDRVQHGFTQVQLMSEYRALRENVSRRWRAQLPRAGDAELEDLMRFNDALDHALVKSTTSYQRRLDDARDLLQGVLAHDLRSPLGAVLASAEVLLRRNEADLRDLGERVRASGQRMAEMIDDLLDFTRTRLGSGLHLARSATDLGPLAAKIVAEARLGRPQASIDLETSGDLWGQWDAGRLEQVLSNLIGNALDHGTLGGRVSLAARGSEESVILTVRNEGVIPESARHVIFDPLRRAVSETDRCGLGLGLFIVRQVVEAHGGSITLESSQQHGTTTFHVELPRRGSENAGGE